MLKCSLLLDSRFRNASHYKSLQGRRLACVAFSNARYKQGGISSSQRTKPVRGEIKHTEII